MFYSLKWGVRKLLGLLQSLIMVTILKISNLNRNFTFNYFIVKILKL